MVTIPKNSKITRPIKYYVWIVERMRYRDRQTDRPTDTASFRGALSHLKIGILMVIYNNTQQHTKQFEIHNIERVADASQY